ncbi:RluA family pseudouridine synthase [Sporosarcina sp. BI001-red]|uniref:RluA family pseudouridine synthase n=1 Tax=Sporosarcina sp. BI001-red TaxID=2282866 RepID=UPI000E28861F|nr:RluA family pseudouridine synthase [Sporosarcina sp. BI001-red]REB06449.1 RluA family pseudouridine synthase [Sporosarcina sp. BI001-red]
MRDNSKPTTPQAAVYKVVQEQQLLPFLLQSISKSRNAVKSILSRGQVSVNGKPTTRHDQIVNVGDKVEIMTNQAAKSDSELTGLSIMYEDDAIIVIDKEAGLLSMAAKDKKEMTAFSELSTYIRKANRSSRVFIVHRLDRETSGVMLFAKTEEVKKLLQDNWEESVQERGYIALVEGKVRNETGEIISWLKETRTFKVYSNPTDNGGQKAITRYKLLQSSAQFSLLELRLETGRKNQIRVHMEEMGHPVVGDKKYGATTNPIKRLGLHAVKLTIIHPITKEQHTFISDPPTSFYKKSK